VGGHCSSAAVAAESSAARQCRNVWWTSLGQARRGLGRRVQRVLAALEGCGQVKRVVRVAVGGRRAPLAQRTAADGRAAASGRASGRLQFGRGLDGYDPIPPKYNSPYRVLRRGGDGAVTGGTMRNEKFEEGKLLVTHHIFP
jgi:hypothetical protein